MSTFDVRDLLKTAQPAVASAVGGGALGSEAPVPGGAALEAPVHAASAVTSARVGILGSPVVLAGSVRAFEFLLLAILGLGLRSLLRQGSAGPALANAAAIAGLAVCLFQAAGAYRLGALQRLRRAALALVAGWTIALMLVAAALIFIKAVDRAVLIWLVSFYSLGLGLLVAGRAGLLVYVRSKVREGVYDRWTAIVGGGKAAEELIHALEASGESGVRIIGVFDDRNDDRSADSVAGYPKLGAVSDLVAYARRARVDLIVFTLPISAENRLLQMLAKLWVLPIDIRLSAHTSKLRLRPRAYSYLGSVPVLDVFDKPLADWDMILKAAFDRLVALCALIALCGPMLAVALAVKLTSRGPIIFRQKRYGFNNELIEVFKFRSMYVDQGDSGAAKLVTKGDLRVTPVGRFIRKTSLDELPQLFNVLKGDLSLVGPRPHALQAKAANTLYDQVVDGYFARHKVKPGITGWAQINGWRGETDTSEKIQKRVEHDLYYIENWSILFDMQILAKTPFALLKTDNAY